jgi:SAM-dependent methyltransferase
VFCGLIDQGVVMDSKEFGLVAAQQLLQAEDLHYGFWEAGEIPKIENVAKAQNNHTVFLFKHIESVVEADRKQKILDVGCGIGVTTKKLLQAGYRVDGLVPSNWMAQQARKNTQPFSDSGKGEIYECPFEDFPASDLSEKYALIFFSESFQYVKLQLVFEMIDRILTEKGTVIIFDFFKRDNVTGKSPMGGGHSIGKFLETVKKSGYVIDNDLDVTENLSPNLRLVNDILVDRIIPFSETLDAFLSTRHKYLYRIVKWFFRKKLAKLQFKYSQNRNEDSFRKYKTYRLFVLKRA